MRQRNRSADAQQDLTIEPAPALPATQGVVSLRVADPERDARDETRRPPRLIPWRSWAPFAAIVLLPTILATVYFGFVAADRYVAEAKFVIRSAERVAPTGLGALLQSTGLSAAQDDAFIVHAFIESRDALSSLEEEIGFSDMMSLEAADPLARWPGLFSGDSFEELHDYYQRRVSVVSDGATGISTLRVEAFTPDDARLIVDALLSQSEAFVNEVNASAQRDALDLARREVALAEERVAENQRSFSALRRDRGLVDPEADTDVQFNLVAALSVELATVEAELDQLRADSPRSPRIAGLESRADALRRQVIAERAKLVGADGALIEAYGAFESLALEREFSSEALLAAQAALEQARSEAARQQLYLARVTSARAPDYAREPERTRMIVTVFSVSLLIYAVVWLLYVNAREHRS